MDFSGFENSAEASDGEKGAAVESQVETMTTSSSSSSSPPSSSSSLNELGHFLPNLTPIIEENLTNLLVNNGIATNGSGTNRTTVYCGEIWQTMWEPYNHTAHVYLLIAVGLIGCLTNILNILVFTRKSMKNSTNTILTALSMTDFLFAFFPLIFGIFFVDKVEWSPSYSRAVLSIANEFAFLLIHTWSIYLTLVLGIWRCLGVLRPLQSRSWCTFKAAKLFILAALFIGLSLVSIMHISIYVCDEGGKRLDYTDKIPFWRCQLQIWSNVRYWIHAIGIKIGPCLVLTIMTLTLIQSLIQAKKQRKMLSENLDYSDHDHNHIEVSGGNYCDRKNDHHHQSLEQKESNRTNKILAVVLLIFIFTEAPTGIFNFIAALVGHQFYIECYRPAAYFWNLNEFISTTTSFFVYFSMSVSFRTTFLSSLRTLVMERRLRV